MKYILYILTLSFLVSCGSHVYKPSKNALRGADHIADIQAATKNIDEIVAGTPEESSVTPETKNITNSAGKLDKIIEVQDKELAKARDSYYQLYQRWLSILIILSFLTVSVSIALLLMGHLRSVTLTVIAASIFCGALALQMLTAYAVYIAGGFALFIGGFIIYAVVVKNKSIGQIVESVEVGIKKNAIDPEKFGEIADGIQGSKAKKLVDQFQALFSKKSK